MLPPLEYSIMQEISETTLYADSWIKFYPGARAIAPPYPPFFDLNVRHVNAVNKLNTPLFGLELNAISYREGYPITSAPCIHL